MNRKDFIRNSLILGVGLPFLTSSLFANRKNEFFVQPDFQGKVIIIGAGAAGLSAGYFLKQLRIDFTIVEAASQYGGRIKKSAEFGNFPIDLGAEWIHTDPGILEEIFQRDDILEDIDILDYSPESIQTWNKSKLRNHRFLQGLYSEWKFKHTTWFDFFEQKIIPSIQEHIVLNTPIEKVQYHGDQVFLTALNGQVYKSEKVLITSSIKVFQNRLMEFSPSLPQWKEEAISKVFMGDGLKIFIEFKKRFYPDMLAFGKVFQALIEEDKFVYDAAFGKGSDQHILGLFAINNKAYRYIKQGDDQAIISSFLAELDQIFDGQASKYYRKHIVQNWSNEPYILGAYSYSFDGNKKKIIEGLQAPVADKIYFAGEALSVNNHSMVHGACQSAYSAINQMVN